MSLTNYVSLFFVVIQALLLDNVSKLFTTYIICIFSLWLRSRFTHPKSCDVSEHDMFDKTIVGQRLNHQPNYLKCNDCGSQQLPATTSNYQQLPVAAAWASNVRHIFGMHGSESIVFIIHNLFSLPWASAKWATMGHYRLRPSHKLCCWKIHWCQSHIKTPL